MHLLGNALTESCIVRRLHREVDMGFYSSGVDSSFSNVTQRQCSITDKGRQFCLLNRAHVVFRGSPASYTLRSRNSFLPW